MIETTRLTIRPIEDKDFDLYALLAKEHKLFRRFYVTSPEETKNSYWKMIRESGAEYFSVFVKNTDDFCGCISIHHNEEQDCFQYEINILTKYQGMRLGPEATQAFMEWLKKEREISHLYLEITPDNGHAKSMFDSLGAKEQLVNHTHNNELMAMIENATGKSSSSKIKKYELDW